MDDLLLQYMNAEDEPSANEFASALSKALRRKQELGTLGVLSGGALASPGAALLGASGEDAQGLMHAQVARTARLDRKSAQDLAGIKDLRDFQARQREQQIDNKRADEQNAATLALAKSGQAIAAAGLGYRGHEVAAADDQRAKAATDKAEGEVRQLAATVGDSPAMVAEKAARLREALAKHPEGELPGFGRVTSVLPDAVVSDEGRDVRSDARELVNTLLFLQSGAGVSNQERENKYNAYGLGKGASETAFRQGFAKLQNDLAGALKAKQAGFTPQTIATYKERGGVTPEAISGGGKKKFVIKNGKLVPAGG
jgi:hypothetical protein